MWPTATIGELCDMVKGQSPTMKTSPGDYPFVVTAEARRTADSFQLVGPAVCVPLISSTGHGHASMHRVHYQEGKFALADLLVALLPKDPDQLDCKFLYWLLTAKKNDYFVPLMQGTANVSLKISDIASVIIPVPTLAEQHRIVTKMERLVLKVMQAQDVGIQAKTASSEIMTAATSALFACLTDVPSVPINELGIHCTNPIQIGPFGAQLHSSEYVEDGVPVLNVGNVWPEGLRTDRLNYVTPSKASQLSRYTVDADDLLFARSGATLGKVCLVPKHCRGWLMTAHLFRVRFDPLVCLPQYAFAALRGARTVRDQVFGQVRGATRPGFNTTLLGNIRLPVPSIDEQQRLVDHLEGVQAKVDRLNVLQSQTSAELDALVPAILDRAFRGEL